MAEESLLETLLRLKVDATEAARAVAAVAKVQNAMDDLNKAALQSVKVSSQQTAAIDKTTKSFIRQQLELKGVIDANGKLLKQQAESARGSGQGLERGLSSLAQIAPGPAGNALRAGADITGAIDDIGGVKEALAGLGPVGLAAAVGIGAVSLALVEQNKIASETTNGLKLIVERERQFYELRVAGTTKSIQAAVQAAEFEQKVAQARVDDLKFVEQGYKQTAETLGVFTGAVIELGGAIGVGGLGNIRDARMAYDEANEALGKANQNLNLYKGLLDDTSTATNDAAAAEAELSKARQQLTDQIANTEIQTLLRASTMSSDAANDRLMAIRDEIEISQKYIDSGTLSAEATAALQTKITLLAAEMAKLNIEVLPVIQARENEVAALKEQKRILDDTAQAAEDYTDNLKKIEADNLEKRAQLAQAYGDKVEQIAQNAVDAAESALHQLEQRKADLARDLARAGEEADIQAARDAIDLQIKAQREELKALRNYQDEVKRINKEGNRSDLEAIEGRDAVALAASQRQRQDALSEAKTQFDNDRRERQIANNEATADQRTQYAREREDRIRKFNQDLADAQAAYMQDLQMAENKRQQDLQRAAIQYAREQAQQNAAYNQRLLAARNAAIAEITLAQRTDAQILAADTATRNAQLALARQLMASVASTTAASAVPLTGGVGNHPYPTPPSLDTGGQITRTGLALVHRGESIVNPARGQSAGGVTVNINGVQMRTVDARSKQHAIDTVVEYLQEQLG